MCCGGGAGQGGFCDGSVVKNNLPAILEMLVQSLGWEDPLERKWRLTPVFLPGKSHGWRSLVGYSPWGHKELDTTERLNTYAQLVGVSLVAEWIRICLPVQRTQVRFPVQEDSTCGGATKP